MFAAFPEIYATLFSGFYVALVFMVIGLIIRGVAFEFRSKREDPIWRNRWDWALFLGSLLAGPFMGRDRCQSDARCCDRSRLNITLEVCCPS